jgi:hypothetical protein
MPDKLPEKTGVPPHLRKLFKAARRVVAQREKVERLRKAYELLGRIADHLRDSKK